MLKLLIMLYIFQKVPMKRYSQNDIETVLNIFQHLITVSSISSAVLSVLIK